jgi:hypothetical protein
VLGLMLFNTSAIAGMACGILVFIIAYTAIEHTAFVQRLLAQKVFRRTAQIGYGTRIGISIVFPVGFYLDLFVGFVSVPTSQWAIRLFGNPELATRSEEVGGFVGTFITTIVQGACLNVLLFIYMLIVFAIVRAAIGNQYPQPSKYSKI